MNVAPAAPAAPETALHPKVIGLRSGSRSLAEQACRLRLVATELAELAEADLLEFPDDDGCIARDMNARAAREEAIHLCQIVAQLPKEEQEAKRPLWMVWP